MYAAYFAGRAAKATKRNEQHQKEPANMAADLVKPKGRRVTYVFTSGERLHIFDVTEQNLSGAWHRTTSADGKQYVIDPSKVNYIINEVIA